MPLLTRSLLAAGAAALIAVAAPLPAHATPAYPPLQPDTWAVTIHPGTVVTHTVPQHTFDETSGLRLGVTGTSSAPTLGTFAASQLGAPMQSSGTGGAVIRLDFGLTTRGVYDVTLVQSGTDHNSYGVVTVIPDAAAVVPAAQSNTAAAATRLPQTGTHIDEGVLWGAAAAVVVGAVLWAVTAVRRRARRAR